MTQTGETPALQLDGLGPSPVTCGVSHPLVHPQQSHRRGRVPAILSGTSGRPETSWRAQRPRRPLLGPVRRQNALLGALRSWSHHPHTPVRLPSSVAVLQTQEYRLPPHRLGRAPPLLQVNRHNPGGWPLLIWGSVPHPRN